MSQNPVVRWVQGAFRETPWTVSIIGINIATWLLNFFGVKEVGALLTGEVGVATAWRWLTYPLFTPLPILWLMLSLYVFFLFSSSLERRWGSEKYIRVFVVVTLLSAFSFWLGEAALTRTLNPSFSMSGLLRPDMALLMIWAALNAEATILAFFVIPVKAKYLAWAIVVIDFFQSGNPLMGLFVISVPVGAWYWARLPGAGAPAPVRKGPSMKDRIAKKKRERKKNRFKLLEGKGQEKSGPETKVPDLRRLSREMKEKEKTEAAAELDRILDKIRFEGMSALTDDEKETLDRQSRRLNDGE